MTSLHYLDAAAPPADALAALPGYLADWFRQRFGDPTAVQRLVWPALLGCSPLSLGGDGVGARNGKRSAKRQAEATRSTPSPPTPLPHPDRGASRAPHLLVSAPTGTGKTLAALVPILADLLGPQATTWSDSRLRVVYVAPLRALVNDAARGLQGHLDDLAAYLPPGVAPPRLAVRTGDTSPAERRLLHDDPPDILLTTPESLAVLLSQPSAALLFANLAWAVVDEVHALAGNKRGADLAVSLERLGEVRRVGLSATATPLDTAARWLVGADRSCAVARAPLTAPPQLTLEPLPEDTGLLRALLDRLAGELPKHRATLVFTNTRALAERLAWNLRRRLPGWDHLVGVHHGAIAAERRRDVERRLKQGQLRAVVSSTSLELGIDIGTVDLAVLVHPPGDVVRLLQRVGRAGHDPDGVRRGLVLTATAAELLEAAVTAASGRAGQCEPFAVPAAPLDVLAQQVLGMCCARACDADELFAVVRRSAPFADLTRQDFDDCLAYLRGVDRGGEAWLPARLGEDGDCWRVRDARTARLLRRNLGTILAERAVPVLLRQPGEDAAPIPVGEVDEAFADRLQPGDRFLLDGRCLEFRAREDGAAVVEEVVGRPRVPVWGGEGLPLSAQLAQRLYVLRTQAAEALRDGPQALSALLASEYGLGAAAVATLVEYFQLQECVSEVPDAGTLLIEEVQTDVYYEYYLHTPLNRAGNDALARIAVRRLARDLGRSATSLVADLGFALRLRGPIADAAQTLRTLLAAEGLAGDLDAALAESEALRQRFARVAHTGLMLLRNPDGRRRKVGGADWPQRRLFEQVRGRDPQFVLLRQALREVRAELCDADAALAYAGQLPLRTVRCRRLPRPSPFAAAWTQPAAGPADLPTPAEALVRLHEELTRGADARSG